jgi:hypothetical protein
MPQSTRISYNLYKASQYIGFCVIYRDATAIRGTLLLFEKMIARYEVSSGNDSGINKNFPSTATEPEILRSLLDHAFPDHQDSDNYTFRREGKTFSF